MALDKPVVQYSIAQLNKEVDIADPFQVALSNSKIITFPDVYAIEAEGAEELLENIRSDSSNWKLLRKWLSPEDADALKAEKLALIKLVRLVKAAVAYYEEFYGKPGEDSASEN